MSIDIAEAARRVQSFQQASLKDEIWKLEAALQGSDMTQCREVCSRHGIDRTLLDSSLEIKRVAGQINVVIHAIGIAAIIPLILEPGETIEYVSLGAGNTGRKFDLETDRRVAEFKFIIWRGADTVREDGLFKDFFKLAEDDTEKRRELFVINRLRPLKFLMGRRAMQSVTSRHRTVSDRFKTLYGDHFQVVGDYYDHRKDLVAIVDINEILPGVFDTQ